MSPDPNRLEKLCCAGPVWIRAQGRSMGPRYSGEDLQFQVRPLSRRRPLPGTLLAWQDQTGSIVIHRLLIWAHRFGAFRYYTKGDGNQGVDPSVMPDQQFVAEVFRVKRGEEEIQLTTLPRRLGGLAIAIAALPRVTWKAMRKPPPTSV